jgi:hypothetical protein
MLATDQWVVRHNIFHPIQCPPPAPTTLPERGKPFLTMGTHPNQTDCRPLAAAARAHVGVIAAYEPLCPRPNMAIANGREEGLIPVHAPEYQGEAWLEANAGTVRLVRHTDNRFVLRIDASRPAVLTLNQNGDPGWTVSDPACSPPFIDAKKRVALRVPAGKRTITLRYRPPFLGLGLALSFGTLLGLLVLRRQQHRKFGV